MADWIKGAIKKPGSLRAELGVKGDRPIPAKKLNAAAKKGGKEGSRARLAKTLKGFHHGMQMGPSGYGMTHGYDSGDAPNTDISHECK